MLESFRDKRTAAVWAGSPPKGFPADVADVARRKLRMLDAATRLDDLEVPPGNRLEALKDDRAGQRSIRVNDHWHVCFAWRGGARGVEVTDYTTDCTEEWALNVPGKETRTEEHPYDCFTHRCRAHGLLGRGHR